jgi:hypothetical protein
MALRLELSREVDFHPDHPGHPDQGRGTKGFSGQGGNGHPDHRDQELPDHPDWTDDRAWIREVQNPPDQAAKVAILAAWVTAAGGETVG